MFTWSHLMLNVIIFGFRPEVILGTLVVDVFDHLKLLQHLLSGKVDFRIAIKDEKKFNELTDTGIFHGFHLFLHSFWILGLVTSLSLYFHFNSNQSLFLFFSSWSVHILADYLTHKQNFYPLFPLKKWKLKLGIMKYDPMNLKVMIPGDIILLILMILRLRG